MEFNVTMKGESMRTLSLFFLAAVVAWAGVACSGSSREPSREIVLAEEAPAPARSDAQRAPTEDKKSKAKRKKPGAKEARK